MHCMCRLPPPNTLILTYITQLNDVARTLSNQSQNLTFSGRIMREIMDNPIGSETPQARLKQVGMMMVLYAMVQAQQPLTLTRIMEITHLTRSGVKETVDQLIGRKILTETMVKNALGRGMARQFEIATEFVSLD
jgi:hypothetical protein